MMKLQLKSTPLFLNGTTVGLLALLMATSAQAGSPVGGIPTANMIADVTKKGLDDLRKNAHVRFVTN